MLLDRKDTHLKNTNASVSRRAVLSTAFRALTTAGIGAAVGGLTMRNAHAAGSSHRVLVCVYLFGGNDANNMVVPLSQYDAYARGRGDLALATGDLLRIRAGSTQEEYGLHPSLSELQPLFQAGSMAVVSNVGHVDGTRVAPGHLDPTLRYVRPGFAAPGWTEASGQVFAQFPALRQSAAERAARASGVTVVSPGISLTPRDHAGLSAAATEVARSLRTQFPDTSLGAQLQQVAGLIKSGSQAGMSRQVFFCGMGGFATSVRQSGPHAALLRDLSASMSAFFRATEELGVAGNVTAYTDSEFSRTLAPNKFGGTDPAWGGHQLVLGGSVLGGDVYGRFPNLALGGPDDLDGRGVFQPAQSKDQYNATLATWFGLQYPDLVRSIPAIANYSSRSLGFVAG